MTLVAGRGRPKGNAVVRVRCRVADCERAWEVNDDAASITGALLGRKGHEAEHILRGECPDRTRV